MSIKVRNENKEFEEIYSKGDFSILVGQKNVEASSGSNIHISYPSGYTQENCVPICCGIKYSEAGYNYVGKYDNSNDIFFNAVKRTLTLGSEDIVLRIENPTNDSAKTYSFKIVLMKFLDYVEGVDYTVGDINGDGEINQADLTLLQEIVQNDTPLTLQQFKSADVNRDGNIDTGDTFKLGQYINGTISTLD